MNKDIKSSRDNLRDTAMRDMVTAIRESQAATDILDEAFTTLLGINRTDGRCLDILQRLGPITAGQLAAEAGLTTGAVTPLVDRLEKAGYVSRRRDTVDRRKVFIESTALTKSLGALVYDEMRTFGENEMTEMPLADMQMIARFMRTSAILNRGLADVLAANLPAPNADSEKRLAAARSFAAAMRKQSAALKTAIDRVWEGK
ncbi:MAG: MarR family transcriptional regulator [Devosia sp.]